MGGYASNSGMYPSGGRPQQQFMSGKGQGMPMRQPMMPQSFGDNGADGNARSVFEAFDRDARAGYRAPPTGKGQGMAPPQFGSQAVSPEDMQRSIYMQQAQPENRQAPSMPMDSVQDNRAMAEMIRARQQQRGQPAQLETPTPLEPPPEGVGFTPEQWNRRQNDAINQMLGQLAGGLGAYAPSGMRGMPQQYGGYSGKGQQNQNFPQQFQQPMAQPRPQMTPYGYPGRSQRQFQPGMSGKGQY